MNNEHAKKIYYVNHLINKKQKQIDNLKKIMENPEFNITNSYHIDCPFRHSEEIFKDQVSEVYGLPKDFINVIIETNKDQISYTFKF